MADSRFLTSTPIKSVKNSCLLCLKTFDRRNLVQVHSQKGQAKNYQELIFKYCDFSIVQGKICRSCAKKMTQMEQTVSTFKENLTLAKIGIKRCANSPLKQSQIEQDSDISSLDSTISKSFGIDRLSLSTCTLPDTTVLEHDVLPVHVETDESSSHQCIAEIDTSVGLDRLQLSSHHDNECDSVHISHKEVSVYSSDNSDCTELSKPHTSTQILPENTSILNKKGGARKVTSDHLYDKTVKVKRNQGKVRRTLFDKSTPAPTDHCYIPGQEAIETETEIEKNFRNVLEQDFSSQYLGNCDINKLKHSLSGSILVLTEQIFSLPSLKEAIIHKLTLETKSSFSSLAIGKKQGNASCLLEKTFDDLSGFTWQEVVIEFQKRFPSLYDIVVNSISSKASLLDDLPRIGLIYGICAQTSNEKLSRVQKVLTTALIDSLCEQKVYDRLNRSGIVMSYQTSLRILEEIGEHSLDKAVKAIENDHRIRMMGDNVNYRQKVAEERSDNKGTIHHNFASAIVVQKIDLSHLNNERMARPWKYPLVNLLLTQQEWDSIKLNYIVLIVRVAVEKIPSLAFLGLLDKPIRGRYSEVLSEINDVIPLPLDFKNEQCYKDLVDILDGWVRIVVQIYREANKPLDGVKIPVGGDQLTREKICGAMTLHMGGWTPEERYEYLGPVTFEFLHMMMKILQYAFNDLYKTTVVHSKASLKGLETATKLTTVKPDPHDAYGPCKDFFLRCTDAYIVEALLTFFGMETITSRPTKNIAPEGMTKEQEKTFYEEKMDKFISFIMDDPKVIVGRETVIEEAHVFNVVLRNGQNLPLPLPIRKPEKDGINNYARHLLEMGLLVKEWYDLIKNPDRDRCIRLLKLTMGVAKSCHPGGKYPYEMARMLTHQLAVLSEREANEVFYGLFINTRGKVDSFVPADEYMEWIVGIHKKLLKHTFSNKTEENIMRKTRAYPAVCQVAAAFDLQNDTLIRSKKHSKSSSDNDDRIMQQELRSVRPFEITPGRAYTGFEDITPSTMDNLDMVDYRKWLKEKIEKYATEYNV